MVDFTYGKLVEIQRYTIDKRGVLVAVVTPHGASASASARQLAEGMAWWDLAHSPSNKVFSALEREAKESRRGLWGESSPTPPWRFRNE